MSSHYKEDPNHSNYLSGSDPSEYNGDNTHSGRDNSDDVDKGAGEEEPMTLEEKEAAIERLVASMKDCSELTDQEAASAVKRIQGDTFYPEKAYRRLATKQLYKAVQAQRGPLVEKHHKQSYKHYPTVADRLDALNNAYKRSKSVVKMDLDPHYGDKLIDDPNGQLKQKRSNLILNTRRNTEVREGKKVLAKLEKESDDVDDGDNANVDGKTTKNLSALQKAITPIKRKTPAKTKSSTSAKKARLSQVGRLVLKAEENTSPTRQQRPSSAVFTYNMGIGEAFSGSVAMHPASPAVTEHRTWPFNVADPPSHLDADLQNHYLSMMTAELEHALDAQGERQSPGMVAEMNRRYRIIICLVLGVDLSWASSGLTLTELRLYGRAYFAPLANLPWRVRGLPAAYDAGFADLVWTHADRDGGVENTHFTNVLTQFRPLAIARGDIHEDGSLVLQDRQYLPPLSAEQMRALGLDPNVMGSPPY